MPKNHYCRELCSTAHGGRTELKMSDKKISKAKSIKRAKRLTELVISLAIVASGVYLVKRESKVTAVIRFPQIIAPI